MKKDYKISYIKTKNKTRKIVSYVDSECELRRQHEFIATKLNDNVNLSLFTQGYAKGHSIYTNALMHINNNYFVKIDIKNFFQSINHKKLINALYREIKDIASPGDCYTIVDICSISNKGLPLGFVTSPILANIYLKSFDIKFYQELKKLPANNIVYTRYADDMVISFKSVFKEFKVEDIFEDIKSISSSELKKYSLKLNAKKTKFVNLNKSNHVRVTGISIAEKNGKRRLSIGRNQKRKFFYEVLNYYDSNDYSEVRTQQIKGKLSFYLSIEKVGFEDFLSEGMKKELLKRDAKSFIELIYKIK